MKNVSTTLVASPPTGIGAVGNAWDAAGQFDRFCVTARELNGSLTALLLYMGEINQHSQRLSQAGDDSAYLRQVVENAHQQTKRACLLMNQIASPNEGAAALSNRKAEWETWVGRVDDIRATAATVSTESDQKPLTKREREVLDLIIQGYSNKQGALQMHISYRTFESHRAEAMRKLGARNTADLVRKAVLHSARDRPYCDIAADKDDAWALNLES